MEPNGITTNGNNGNGNGSNKRSLRDDGENQYYDEYEYIPASTWQGVKPGYYFTTAAQGTGYYLDKAATDDNSKGGPPRKKKKKQQQQQARNAAKSVRIAEDRNETRTIIAASSAAFRSADSAEALLAEAELRAAKRKSQSKVVALTVAGAKVAAAALKKAIETNAVQRAKNTDTTIDAGGGDSGDGAAAALLFMESEVALYEHVAALKAFAADPATLYPVLLEQQVQADLVQLLLHDNVDIAVAATSVLLEWLDSDLLLQLPDEQEPGGARDTARRRNAVTQMAAALLASEGAELLVENLARMQRDSGDDDDEVGRGVEDILSLLENLLEMDVFDQQQPLAITDDGTSVAAVLCKQTAIIPWIFQQLLTTDDDGDGDGASYRNRSMELLAYVAPREDIYTVLPDWSRIPAYTSTLDGDNSNNNNNNKMGTSKTVDGIEILLQSVAAFRKRQPATEQEVEFLENCCMVVASVLTYSTAALQAFLDAQGIELVMRCLKERVYAGSLALKWLDFSGSDDGVYRRACEHLVHAGALKHIFPLFMGRNLPKLYHTDATTTTAKQKRAKRELHHAIERTTVRILYALVRHLRDDSPHDVKARVLAKFVYTDNDDVDDVDKDDEHNNNNNNEKVNRLVELLLAYDQRVRLAEYKFFRSDVEEALMVGHREGISDGDGSRDNGDNSSSITVVVQLAALEAKLAAGGDILHRLAAVAAFCCAGSRRCHRQILAALRAKESGIGLIRDALGEFVSVLVESEQKRQLQSYLDQI